MFIKSDLLFTELKQKIKLFLGKYGHKPRGVHDAEYNEVLARYKEITNDYSFQDKLQELSLLEAVLIQANCMQNLAPVVSTNKTAKHPSLYVRNNYPTIKGKTHILTKSLGPRMRYPQSIRSLQENPEFMTKAKSHLREAMEENFIYKAYKIRYPNS
jgi:hypothetical protein